MPYGIETVSIKTFKRVLNLKAFVSKGLTTETFLLLLLPLDSRIRFR